MRVRTIYLSFFSQQLALLMLITISLIVVSASSRAESDEQLSLIDEEEIFTPVDNSLSQQDVTTDQIVADGQALVEHDVIIDQAVSDEQNLTDSDTLDNELQELDNDIVLATLPHNLSPWGMFMAADKIVKTVMIGLAIASLVTWTVLLSKSIELLALKRQLRNNLNKISNAHTLADTVNADSIRGVGRELINAARSELQLSADFLKKNKDQEGIKEGVKERVASSLSRIEAASTRRMMIGTGLLATIGAIAPFVGLFGTVWGIMNSFIGISEANTTNLAVVAPGIAEALLATALGLVAAIPAVVIYNHFTRKIATVRALVADMTACVMRLVSRDLDRGTSFSVVKANTAPIKIVE